MSSDIIDAVRRSIGQRIKEARDLRKMGSNELDRQLGKDRNGYISLTEKGREPGLLVASEIARILKVELQWLATEEGPMERRSPSSKDVFPERARAIEMLRELGADRRVFAKLLAHEGPPTGKTWSLRRWFKLGQRYEIELQEEEDLDAAQEHPSIPDPDKPDLKVDESTERVKARKTRA